MSTPLPDSLKEHAALIEKMLANNQARLDRFRAMTPAEQQAAFESAKAVAEEFGDMPADWDMPLSETEKKQFENDLAGDQAIRDSRRNCSN